jgi:iron-sulfur cluster repair protein YtfE (RIC family)
MLKEDHRRVERLFQKVKDTPKGEHPALFEQIKAELDVHTHIEETAFYPVLLKKGKKDLQDITREGLEEHGQAKLFLADLASTTKLNKQYEAKLKVLMEDIEHHVKEEEDEMFPMVEDQFTESAQEKMTAAMEAEKAKFIKKMRPDEKKALERSMAGADEKGPLEKILGTAKEVATNILAGRGINAAPAAKPNGKAKTASAGSNGRAKTTSAKAPAKKAAPKTAAGRETKVKETVRKVQTARAAK